MRRRLLTLCAALSAPLCGACASAWIVGARLPIDVANAGAWSGRAESRYLGAVLYEEAGNAGMALVSLGPRFFLLLSLLFAVMPGWRWWRASLRAGRLRKNCCAACGYDLRATPDRCPECGKPASAAIKKRAAQGAGRLV